MLLYFLSSIAAIAQIRLHGSISTTNAQPVESAYVQICQSSDSLAVAFSQSNAEGAYTLTFTPSDGQSYFLKVSHISHQTLLLSLPADTGQSINIVMQPGNLVLNEVLITARVPIREQGDSTRYKIDAFRNGSEQTLEEVFKKMPNVRVEDNGDIYFKNKRVDKVLIDSDDLIGNSYQLATRSINPAMLNEVQAIENFSENKLLRKIEQGNQTVLNLTVKDNRKSLLFGTVDAAGGPDRYSGIANVFSYSKAIKVFAVLSGNNTGMRQLDLSDATASVLTDERPRADLLIKPFAHTAQPLPRNLNSPLENINNEQVGTFNIAANPSKSLKITANLSLLHDRVQAGRSQAYQLIGDTPVSYSQADTVRQVPSLAHLKVQINYDFSPRMSLLYRGTVGTKRIDLQQTTQFSTANLAAQFPQQFTNRLTDYWQLVEITRKQTDRQAFVLSGQVSRTHLDEQYAARLNPSLWSAVFRDSLTDGRAFKQQALQTNQLLSVQARWLYGTKTHKFEQQVGYQQNTFEANVDQQNATTQLINQPLHLLRQTIYSRTSGRLIWPTVELGAYAQVGYAWATLNGQSDSRNPVQANLNASFRLGQLSRLAFGIEHQASLVANTLLINSIVITDFRSAQQGVQGLLFDERNQLSLSYIFTDISYRKMTLVASAFATRANNYWNLADISFTSDYTVARLLNTPTVSTIGGVCTLEKLVYPLSGNIKLLVNVASVEGLQIVNGASRAINTFVPAVTMEYISAFKGSFYVDLSATYRHTALSVMQNGQVFQQYFTTWNGYSQFLFRKKSYQLSMTVEGNRIRQNNYLFLKANANFIVTPRLSLKLDGMNLLNQTTYQQIAISPTTYSVGLFPLLPRMILAGVRYNF